MKTRKSRSGKQAGFSLAEILICISIALVVGSAAYTLSAAVAKLYAENFSLNHSHMSARLPLERIMGEVNNSACPPKLIDADGNDLPDNQTGPAAGIRFCVPASTSNYSIASAAVAAATTVSLTVSSGQAQPRVSDLLVIHAGATVQSGNPIQLLITGVSEANSPYTLTLASALGVDVPAGNAALILQQGRFVVNSGQLRYSNTTLGLNNPRVLAEMETGALPFSYPGDPRLLQVNLRVRSGKYSNRVNGLNTFNSFLQMRSSAATRSTYLESNNTVRSAYLDCARFNEIQ